MSKIFSARAVLGPGLGCRLGLWRFTSWAKSCLRPSIGACIEKEHISSKMSVNGKHQCLIIILTDILIYLLIYLRPCLGMVWLLIARLGLASGFRLEPAHHYLSLVCVTGVTTPRVTWVGVWQVGVRVWKNQPVKNPNPYGGCMGNPYKYCQVWNALYFRSFLKFFLFFW